MDKININIKTKRIEKGLTQEELAKAVYTTKSTISKWESGSITPGVDMLKVIAKALDTKIYELIGESAPRRIRVFDILGRTLFYFFAWIHWDITFTGIVATFGSVAMLLGIATGAGSWIAYVVLYSMTSWGDGSILIVVGALAFGPFFLFFWWVVGFSLLNTARFTANVSLRYFWKTNKRIPEIKRPRIKKWMIILAISSFITGAIFLSCGAALHPDQLNFSFK